MSNVMRKKYRRLKPAEKLAVSELKDAAEHFLEIMFAHEAVMGAREWALAKTKLEEAVMWAVKGVTG